MNKKFYLLLLSSLSLLAEDQEHPVTPEHVENHLQEAEAEFEKAKKMFSPWYTGPLLAPSANVVPPGKFNLQPYLFFTNNFAKYDQHGHAHDIPNLHQIKPSVVFQFGLIKRVYGMITTQAVRNKQYGHSSTNWTDTIGGFGIGLLTEGLYNPGLLISIRETFPTGKYQHLDPRKRGVDATGAGAYQTQLGFNLGKAVWWLTLHPMRFRLAQSWDIPAMVHVRGFNTFGGGHGTRGKVRLGHSYSADFGYEFSFTQSWAAALDVVYTYTQKTKFTGRAGTSATGAPNVVGGPFSDQLSLAPAIEYNVNSNIGFIGGVWFSVWGRNSLDFLSGIFSVNFAF